MNGRQRVAQLQALAFRQGGVVTRAQAYDLGLTKEMVRHQVRLGRWALMGQKTIVVVGMDLSLQGEWRAALSGSSPRAALDGVSALQVCGLRGFSDTTVHVSAPSGCRVAQHAFVTRHLPRRWDEMEVATIGGLRVVVPEVAAVRAAVWLPTDRAAATLLSMAAQQRLVNLTRLDEAAQQLARRGRVSAVRQFVRDVTNGAQSLGELEFGQLCLKYGMPEPDRQVVVRRPNGTFYLDARWSEYGLIVEIDGAQHFAAANAIADLLRHNELALTGDMVMRIPVLGLRVAEAEFMAQVVRGLTATRPAL